MGADVGGVDEEVVDCSGGDVAGVTATEGRAETGGTAVGTASALVVGETAELIGRTRDGAGSSAEEVGDSVDALTGLTDCEGSAGGAGGDADRADVSHRIGELAEIAASEAGGKSDLKVEGGSADGAGSGQRTRAGRAGRVARQTLSHC